MKNTKISINAVRNANSKLVSRVGKLSHIAYDNTKNGTVAFRAVYSGKAYDLSVTKEGIKTAFAKSLASTVSK